MHQQFRSHRYPTAFALTVKAYAGPQRATVVNVNQGGVRLKGVTGVKRGDQIVLQAMNDQIVGVVRWVVQDDIGVSFVVAARPAFVNVLRQGVRALPGGRVSAQALREIR